MHDFAESVDELGLCVGLPCRGFAPCTDCQRSSEVKYTKLAF